MRKLPLPLFALTLLLFAQCGKDDTPCVCSIPEWCNLVDLGNEYDPVCGCNGVTYINAGHAACTAGITEYTPGTCE